jgi:cytochrome P450
MPERMPTARENWPLLGHVPQLRRAPLEFMQSLRARGDVVRVKVGPRPVYVVNAPELIRQVLISDRHRYEKGLLFDKARPVLGNGLVVSEGDFHRRQRQLIQPAFGPERLNRYAVHIDALVRERAESWKAGQVVSLDRELHDLTMSVVDRTLFSSSIRADEAATVHRCLPIVERGFVRRALSPLPQLERLPTPANRRFEAARRELRAVVENLIGRRRDGVGHDDLLGTLIRGHDERGGMSDEQLRDELITLMLAGTDTTALSLTWLFWELGRHPEHERRVQAELDAELDGAPLDRAAVGRLPYLGRVIGETLRLHCPVWIVMRRATREVELGGVRLPAGAEFVISPAALHRDPRLFPEPLAFDPDRWLPERAAGRPRGSFLPFGTGDRQCVGDTYAMIEMTLVTAAIAARWSLRPLPGARVHARVGTLVRPSPFDVVVTPRAQPTISQ